MNLVLLEKTSIPFSDPFEQPLRGSNSFYSPVENTGVDEFSSLAEYKQLRNFVDREFTDEKVDGRNTKTPFFKDSFQLHPFELEDPFVADDTFQDQGPGSVEIYKLDLLREKPLLSPTPSNTLPPKNKSKTPKKISHVSWKPKTTEYKPMIPKISHKQSNSFDDLSTEMPSDNDPFSVGGVPELQVGCEGLEAADQKQKRSINSPRKDRKLEAADPWSDITPVSLEMIYDSSGEEGYEEMDELVKIIKLANATKSSKHRGDMDATREGDFLNDRNGSETVPVRGDLGKTSVASESAVLSAAPPVGNREVKETNTAAKAGEKGYYFNKAMQGAQDKDAGSSGEDVTANQGRKILWFDDREADQQSDDGKRSKRAVWGFGEDEGAVSSDELQTENHRRRQYDERLRQEEERRRQESERRRQEEAQRRGYVENRTNSDIEKIRENYERNLEQRKKEDEERRRRQEAQKTSSNRRQPQDEHRRRVQEEESRNRWQDEERRRQQLEASRRRYESRPQTTLAEQELKRREESRFREEERRRQQQAEEMRRREQSEWDEDIKRRQQQELDRKNLEQRRREWMLKKAQEEEEERKRQQHLRNSPPLNLLYPTRPGRNESEERRIKEQEERERERKYREYVQRNRPIIVNASSDRQREEAQRWRLEEKQRRMEEERKLQEYIRRNQPIHVPRANESEDRNWMEYRRKAVEVRPSDPSRYPSPGNGRRDHGPLASTNIDPRSYVDEARRRDAFRRIEEDRIRERERQEAEQRRQEALRREEEVRRLQSRRYEEQRKRLEAARLADERRRKELIEQEARRSQVGRTRPSQSTRPGYEDRRRFEEHRRRQDTRLIPSNLLLNESRRAVDLERQRQEQQRRRIEAERRRQQETR